jgi:transposase
MHRRQEMVGMTMYTKIQELKALGYKKQRVARQLNVDTKTVRKYWCITEDEYIAQRLDSKERTKMMDPYREFVLDKLRMHSEITSAIIYDNLKEEFKDFTPSYRSVRRYVYLLREAEGILSPMKIRQYMEVAELPAGFQAQVDMGQKTMKDVNGKPVKVYAFAMVLSCSRYKYVCFQLEPFTAKTFCEAHDRAFKYYGGRPVEIVYDQDRVAFASENGAGTLSLPKHLRTIKATQGSLLDCAAGMTPRVKVR